MKIGYIERRAYRLKLFQLILTNGPYKEVTVEAITYNNPRIKTPLRRMRTHYI